MVSRLALAIADDALARTLSQWGKTLPLRHSYRALAYERDGSITDLDQAPLVL